MTASPKWQPNQTPDRQPSSVDSGANRRPPAKPSPKRTESPPALFQLPDLSSEGGVAGPDQAVSASSDSDSTIDRNALPESNHPVTSVAANPSLTPETDTRSASNSEPSSNRVWQPIEEFAEPDRIQPHRVDAALRDTESRNTEPRKGESTDSVPVPVLDTKGTRVISIVLLAMIVSFAAIAVRGLKRFGTPSSDETTEGANLIAESDTTKQRSELEIAPPEISTLTPEVTDALASGTPTPLDAKSFESAFPSSREDIASLDSLPDVSGDSDVDISFDHPFFQGEESTLGGPTSDAMAMSSEAQAISQDGTLGLSSPQNIASGNSVRGDSVRGDSVRGDSVPEFNSAQGNTAAQESFGETPSQLADNSELPIGQLDPMNEQSMSSEYSADDSPDAGQFEEPAIASRPDFPPLPESQDDVPSSNFVDQPLSIEPIDNSMQQGSMAYRYSRTPLPVTDWSRYLFPDDAYIATGTPDSGRQ